MIYIQQNVSNEDSFKVHVVCPVCEKSNYLYIPKESILSSSKGLTTVFIHNGLVCEHSFQIFVDKRGSVRGMETPDFELKFTPTEETIEEPEKQDAILEGTAKFLVMHAIFGEEIFLKCLRCGFNKCEIICISENNLVFREFNSYFENIFGVYTPEIIVVTLDDYNSRIRNTVFGSKHKNIFVFNADLNVIIKQPFEKKYRPEKFGFESSLMQLINERNQTDEQIVEILGTTIKTVFDTSRTLIDKLNHRKIKNKKEMGKLIQKMIGKNVKCEIDDMERLLFSHFQFIPKFIDERTIIKSGFKY